MVASSHATLVESFIIDLRIPVGVRETKERSRAVVLSVVESVMLGFVQPGTGAGQVRQSISAMVPLQ